MSTLDIISIAAVVLAVPLAVIASVLIRRGIFRPSHYPLGFGLGTVTFGILFSVTATVAMRSEGRTLANTLSDIPWMLFLGAVAYLGGAMLARRAKKP